MSVVAHICDIHVWSCGVIKSVDCRIDRHYVTLALIIRNARCNNFNRRICMTLVTYLTTHLMWTSAFLRQFGRKWPQDCATNYHTVIAQHLERDVLSAGPYKAKGMVSWAYRAYPVLFWLTEFGDAEEVWFHKQPSHTNDTIVLVLLLWIISHVSSML